VRKTLAAIAVAVVVVGVAGLALAERPVQAAQVTIEGVASGSEEVPVVTSPGTARVRFVFDDVAKTLTFQATVNGLSQDQVLFAHIHRAARGTNGAVIHTLSATSFMQISGTVNLSDADITDLRAGNLYFNAHSKDNPGGFARFQLIVPAAPAPAAAAALPRVGSGGFEAGSSSWLIFAGLIVMGLGGIGALAFARKGS